MASSRHYVPNYRRLPAGLLAILAVLAAAVLATGYGYYRHAARQLRLDAESSLHSIADLKANQLARWRMERLGDGLVLQDSPFFSTAAMDLEKNPRNSAVQNALRIRLLETQRAYGYQGCLLLNVKLKVLVSTGHPSSLKNSFLEKLALQTLATGKTHLTDLYLSGSPPRPVMVELIPLFKNPLHRSGQARALAVFTIDPARYLYTILARWPIKTPRHKQAHGGENRSDRSARPHPKAGYVDWVVSSPHHGDVGKRGRCRLAVARTAFPASQPFQPERPGFRT
ncbi:MAG: hypothetical protein P8018_12845 [Acidobacteriota bacterium]